MQRLRSVANATGEPAADDESLSLFPSGDSRTHTDDWLTRRLEAAARNVRAGRVAPSAGRAQAETSLAGFDFASPLPLRDVLDWIVGHMEGGMVQMGHPRYFGLFNPAPTFASQCADRIVAVFNAQLASATTSPLPVALERHVIAAIATRLGMQASSGGHFTTGGSEANATAVICALTKASPAFAEEGIYAFRNKPRLYVSKDSHLAWLKIAHQTGVGRQAVRLIDTDGQGRMDGGALASALAMDSRNGFAPVLVVSTAGTTGAGMIDNLHANAEIAGRFGAWHHVDAAWGGGAVVSDQLRGNLAGIENADSVTIDAHKWLATTMGCGMFLAAQPAVLSDAFHVVMDCMPSNVADVDPYVTTMQWSRRFLGLRLFAGLATVGWAGYAAHVEHAVRLTDILRRRMAAIGWQIANASPLAVTCLRPPAASRGVRDIARAVVEGGEAWVSMVEFEGEPVIRVCLTNGQSTEADIEKLVTLLDHAARNGI